MKKRNPIAVFGLSIITLGIYDIYWLYKTRQELNKETSTQVPPVWVLFIPFAIFVVLFIALIAVSISGAPTTHQVYSTYNNQTTVSTVQTTSGSHNKAALLIIGLYLLDAVVTFFVSFYWFFKFSKSVNEYTNGKMGTGVTFLLLWVLHLIGVAVVQDTFNDMLESGQVPGTPPPGVPAPASTLPVSNVVTGGGDPLVTAAQPVAATPATPAQTAAPVAPPEATPAATVITPSPQPPAPESPAPTDTSAPTVQS